MSELHQQIAQSHPKLQRGQVWCRTCGSTQKVNVGQALQEGWPKCHGYTMTLDSPKEQRQYADTGGAVAGSEE